MEKNTNNYRTSLTHMEKNKKFPLWLAAAAFCTLGSYGLFNNLPIASWAANLFLIIATIYTVRNNSLLTTITLFNLLFNLYAFPYIFLQINLVSLGNKEAVPFLTQVLWIISLFWATFCLSLQASVKNKNSYGFTDFQKTLNIPKSDAIFIPLVILAVFCGIFLIKGEVVIGVEGGYSAYTENLQQSSGIQEYLIIPLLLAGLTAKSTTRRILLYIVCTGIAVKLSLVGMRIVALMYLLLILWFLSPKLSWKSIIAGFFLGFIAFSILGLLKNAVTFDEMLASIFFEVHGDTVVSHHGNVLWASSTMLKLIDEGILDISIRLQLLTYYIFNTIVPSGILQHNIQNLSGWLQDSGYTSGGGHAAVFTYVAGTSLGTIAFACIFSKICNVALAGKESIANDCLRIWYMMIMITFPRWISYDLGNFFFRLPIYAIVAYIVIHIVNYAGKPHQNRELI